MHLGLSSPSTRFTRLLERRVCHFIQQREILRPGEHALVAVSGGPDSTALLVISARLRQSQGLDLTAAHFDHMLRSKAEAEEDEAYVRRLADCLGLPLTCGRGDVAAKARRAKLSLEDAARRLRYRFLAQTARQVGASVVLLGHTLDDQAETVVLHILRGSGLDGLAAMRPRSPWPFAQGPEVARPLLCLRRTDTQRYCLELGLTPRQDPTNELLAAWRNRVRHEVIPTLRRFNPQVETALARLAEAAASDTARLEAEAAEAWPQVARTQKGSVVLQAAQMAHLDPAVRFRILRRAFQRAAGRPTDLEAAHVEAMLSLLRRGRGKAALPSGVTASLAAGQLTVSRQAARRAEAVPQTTLSVPGTTQAGPWHVETRILQPPVDVRSGGRWLAYLDARALHGPLFVRSRRPGDRLRPLGLHGDKKVQDVLVDAKVPAEERDTVPLLCDSQGVLWVVGHRLDQRVAVKANSDKVIQVRFRRPPTP